MGRCEQQAPLRPGVTRSDGVVIGVELIAPERVAGPMSSCMGLQHEGVRTIGVVPDAIWVRWHRPSPGASGLPAPAAMAAAAPPAECPAAAAILRGGGELYHQPIKRAAAQNGLWTRSAGGSRWCCRDCRWMPCGDQPGAAAGAAEMQMLCAAAALVELDRAWRDWHGATCWLADEVLLLLDCMAAGWCTVLPPAIRAQLGRLRAGDWQQPREALLKQGVHPRVVEHLVSAGAQDLLPVTMRGRGNPPTPFFSSGLQRRFRALMTLRSCGSKRARLNPPSRRCLSLPVARVWCWWRLQQVMPWPWASTAHR